ncbi:MAG: DUF92 domain-containing protein [Sphaerochaeta sp.]|nr:DUF92 domain-containing protein [Sphaerochaeta sp.]MDD3929222.1 DUF92 domain-containing protein [Sphaerochaeta sp.]NCC13211.1 DUF92 domain-containing protein [Spirochaetia bacterium]NCC88856.1 DUF92 domain-containing protein [Spirochaetia bacterium]
MSRYANLVEPNGSLSSLFNQVFFSLPFAFWALALIMLVVSVASYKSKQLTLGGSFAAFLVGLIPTYVLGFGALATLLLFFIAAGVLGKIAKRICTVDVMKIHKKGGTRDAMQVYANGFMALLAGLLYALNPTMSFLVMFGSAVGEAASDTFASEVGILSKTKPVSIITGKPMTPGLSGAVSPLGLASGLLGAVLIGLCFWGCFLPLAPKSAAYASVVALSSFFGCLIDSVLGATVQAHYYDEVNDRITERSEVDGRTLVLERGVRWIDNDMVNFMSNVIAALFGMSMSLLIG